MIFRCFDESIWHLSCWLTVPFTYVPFDLGIGLHTHLPPPKKNVRTKKPSFIVAGWWIHLKNKRNAREDKKSRWFDPENERMSAENGCFWGSFLTQSVLVGLKTKRGWWSGTDAGRTLGLEHITTWLWTTRSKLPFWTSPDPSCVSSFLTTQRKRHHLPSCHLPFLLVKFPFQKPKSLL